MEKIIYLVRHGQASAGTHDYDRLSDIGQTQAKLIGEHWLGSESPPTAAYAGTLLRQRDTAILAGSIAAEQVHNYTHQGLDEYDHKHVHKHYSPTKSTIDTDTSQHAEDQKIDLAATTTFDEYAQILGNWRNALAQAEPGMESWQQFKFRTLQAVTDCADKTDAKSIALYTSGGAISVITSQIEQLPETDIPRRIWNLHHASITTLRYQSGQLSIDSFNEICHLEKHANPALLTLI